MRFSSRALRYVLSGLLATTLLTGCKKDPADAGPPSPFAGWTALPAPPQKRIHGSVLGLRDGRLLSVGGQTDALVPIRGTDFYSPTTRTWTSLNSGLTGNGFLFEATNGDVFAYGGNFGGNGPSGVIYRLPSGSTSWDYLGQIGGFGTTSGVWGGTEISGNRAVFCGNKQLAVWTGSSLMFAPTLYDVGRFYSSSLITLGLNTSNERIGVVGGYSTQTYSSYNSTEILTVPAPGSVTFGYSPQLALGGAFAQALVLNANSFFVVGGVSIARGSRTTGIQPYEVNVLTRTSVQRDTLSVAVNSSTIEQRSSLALLRRTDGQFYSLDQVYQNVGLYNPATRRWKSFVLSSPYQLETADIAVMGNALVVSSDGVIYARTF